MTTGWDFGAPWVALWPQTLLRFASRKPIQSCGGRALANSNKTLYLKFTIECLYETFPLGPPAVVLQHRSGADDRTRTPSRPFLSQSHSFSMVCRKDNRPGGSSDVYVCDVPWVKISCLLFSQRRRLLAFFARLLRP
jgi:hypothetical protein